MKQLLELMLAATLTGAMHVQYSTHASAMGTAFTYQGQLKESGNAVNASADFQFALFDASESGTQIGSTLAIDDLAIDDGLFTVDLDFGASAFTGDERWLQIAVRSPAGSGSFVTLSPRQPIMPAPYAQFALSAYGPGITNLNASNINSGEIPASVMTGNYNLTGAFDGTFIGSGTGLNLLNATNIATGTLPSARLSGVYNNPLTINNPGNVFAGNGAGLTALNASNLTTGTVPSARLAGIYSSTLTLSSAFNSFTGTFSGIHSGTGAGLTGLDATNVFTGTLSDARLSGNVALLNAPQTFSGSMTFSTAPSFTTAGSPFTVANSTLVTNLNADRLDGLDSTAFLQSIPNPLTLNGTNSTHVIRGENASSANFTSGMTGISTGATGSTYGGRFESQSTSGSGVFGWASSASGTTYGGRFQSDSNIGRAVYGLASATNGVNYGGLFQSASPAGIGVYGHTTASTAQQNSGVWGLSSSTSGRGVLGQTDSTTGINYGVMGQSVSSQGRGVAGFAFAGTGTNYGVWGQTDSTAGRGVLGFATATTGITIGAFGQSDSNEGRGVVGWVTANSGETYGGILMTNSTNGYGVYGLANSPTGVNYGVFGRSDSTSGFGGFFTGKGPDTVFVENTGTGRGIQVVAPADTAIWARTTTGFAGVDARNDASTGQALRGYAAHLTGANYGVYGRSDSAAGYGVWAQGRMGASGVKSFRIDHPEDPTNKYLLHYSAESPEVINFYSGKVMLDSAGEAIVLMPTYFARINKDPRYTLTAIGAPMPNLHVADEIEEADLATGALIGPDQIAPVCWFRIAGGAAGAKVSWRVEAVRNDLWVRDRGAPQEMEKTGPERGTYQHPEFYGQPAITDVNRIEDQPQQSNGPILPSPVEAVAGVNLAPRDNHEQD